jgi:hypothetical protein
MVEKPSEQRSGMQSFPEVGELQTDMGYMAYVFMYILST